MPMKSIPDLQMLKAGFPSVKTLLFDMDGTLFDTEKYHTLALQKIGQEQKIIPPLGPKEVHELMMGKADHLLFELIKDWPGFPAVWSVRDFVDEKNRQLLKLLSSIDGASYFAPALKSLLLEARDHGLNVGLVTSSEKVITRELLNMAGLSQFFSYVLTRDDSEKVKPDPWPYLRAMEHFKAFPQETLVFEDSKVGMEAAHAAGAHIIKAEWYGTF